MNSILNIKNLEKSYYSLSGETVAIKDFSLSVNEGEFISIIGSSGCGKSTVLNILAGLDKDYEGDIEFNGELKCGYMLQEDSLFPWLTIMQNACLGLSISSTMNNENVSYVDSLLDKYGLSEFKSMYPSDLSGGMRQRVALIRTLATKPDVLLLDEPFSALDYQTRLQLSDDVFRIIKAEGKTMIMVTHDLAEAISMSDRIVVMSKRPSIIKNVHRIELENKSTPIENRKDKTFAGYYDILWKELDIHV